MRSELQTLLSLHLYLKTHQKLHILKTTKQAIDDGRIIIWVYSAKHYDINTSAELKRRLFNSPTESSFRMLQSSPSLPVLLKSVAQRSLLIGSPFQLPYLIFKWKDSISWSIRRETYRILLIFTKQWGKLNIKRCLNWGTNVLKTPQTV